MNEVNKNKVNENLEQSLQKIIKTTNTFDNFQEMMKTTRSFDEELEYTKAQSRKAIADAFSKMINLSHELEKQNERAIRTGLRLQKLQPKNSRFNRSLIVKLINCLPAKYRNLPLAFRRNPNLVVKYFLGMIIGRVLAIVLYIIAAFIPAIPVPESVQGLVGKPIKALGSAVVSARGFISDPAMIIGVVTTIPTDINKLLQKIGEFFQFYGRRASALVVRTVRNPKLAYEDLTKWSRQHARFFVRLFRSALALTCSFIMIKLAMIFLLPLFGGIAITVMGLKVSILLFVVVRMIVDKVGEFIGTKVFGKLTSIYNQRSKAKG